MGQAIVEVRGLTKKYGEFSALSDLDLDVPRGELFALLGPNGAGKTTTMRMLMGILKPTSGSARIDGLSCFDDRVAVKRLVGFLPDEPVFHDYLRGLEIVDFVGGILHHSSSARSIAFAEGPVLECVGRAIAVVTYGVAAFTGHWSPFAGAAMFALVLVGVVLNAFIATGIGVLGTQALESDVRRRIRPSMTYLYMGSPVESSLRAI